MTASTIAMSFVAQIWLARERGPAGLGEYTATGLFVMVLSAVLFLGMPVAIAQRVAAVDELDPIRLRAAVGAACTASLAFALAALAVALFLWPAFARLIHVSDVTGRYPVALAASAAIIHSFAVNTQLARLATKDAIALTVLQPFAVVVGLWVGGIAAPITPSDLAVLGFVAAGGGAIVVIVRNGYRPTFEAAELGGLLRRAMPATAIVHVQLLSYWVERGMAAIVAGSFGLGAYAAASFLTEAALRTPRALGTFGVPAYARLSADEIGARRVLASQIRLVSTFFLVAGSGFIAASAGLIIAIFGYDFYVSVTALRLLAVALVPLGVALAFASSDIGLGRPSGELTTLGLLLMQALLSLTFGAALSIAGVALASVITWTVAASLFAWRSRARLEPDLRRALLRIFGVAFPMWVIAWRLGVPPMPWPIGTFAAVVIAAVLSVRLILTSSDARLLQRLVPQAFRWISVRQ